jgi:hypothetical protein
VAVRKLTTTVFAFLLFFFWIFSSALAFVVKGALRILGRFLASAKILKTEEEIKKALDLELVKFGWKAEMVQLRLLPFTSAGLYGAADRDWSRDNTYIITLYCDAKNPTLNTLHHEIMHVVTRDVDRHYPDLTAKPPSGIFAEVFREIRNLWIGEIPAEVYGALGLVLRKIKPCLR